MVKETPSMEIDPLLTTKLANFSSIANLNTDQLSDFAIFTTLPVVSMCPET